MIINNVTKQEIIQAIQQTAKQNGGKPLGTGRFEKETNIKIHEWKRYWPRFSDALIEAGFIPNQLQGAYDKETIIKSVIVVMRKLNKFPTFDELRVEKQNNPEFPSREVFVRIGKNQLAKEIFEYCTNKGEYEDVAGLCQVILKEFPVGKDDLSDLNVSQEIGEVYLFKSGRYYKIGKTNDSVRPGGEIRIQLPEKMDLIHSIKTDDPSGIEAYWHRRFETKRMKGEWFDLNSTDIKAFKRWRRIA